MKKMYKVWASLDYIAEWFEENCWQVIKLFLSSVYITILEYWCSQTLVTITNGEWKFAITR